MDNLIQATGIWKWYKQDAMPQYETRKFYLP